MKNLSVLGFVGAGKAAQVLCKGFMAAGLFQSHQIVASAPTARESEQVRTLGCNVTTDNRQILRQSQVIFLAVKPQVMPIVLKDIAPVVSKDHLLLSIAAGVTIESMQKSLPDRTRIARLMINTPVQFREGVTAYTLGRFAREEDEEAVIKLMSSVGYCTDIQENLMDAVTALSGGGPAYIYLAIEALADGGVSVGLTRQQALMLAAKSVSGASRMVLETGQHPGELKDAVCSGGGSTIAGIRQLEKGGFRSSLVEAVVAATSRAQEIGRKENDKK